MIVWWEIVTDTIREGAPPSGETLIEARCDLRNSESPQNMIKRGVRECYDYLDVDGYSLIPAIPHPRNGDRGLLRPLYLYSFAVEEDKQVAGLFRVSMSWAVAEKIEGGLQTERIPPTYGQWSEDRQILWDPNPPYEMHRTAAGEMIRNLTETVTYPTLNYSYRTPALPDWFESAQLGPINEDFVKLDGKTYEPYTLWASSASCTSIVDQTDGTYWRDINLSVSVNPEGWDKQVPHLGYYELRMVAREYKRKAQQPEGAVSIAYEWGKKDIDIYQYISNQQDVDRFMEAAREGRTVSLNGVNVRIVTSYAPITTIINPSPEMDAKDVDEPVPLDKNGVAYRIWKPGAIFASTDGSTTNIQSASYPLFLRTDLKPEDILIYPKRTKKLARFSRWGLW